MSPQSVVVSCLVPLLAVAGRAAAGSEQAGRRAAANYSAMNASAAGSGPSAVGPYNESAEAERRLAEYIRSAHGYVQQLARQTRWLELPTEHVLIALYAVLIVFGAAGNSLVIFSVLRKPAMRTARNVFILNLAVSDLILCLLTMPFTLISLLYRFWPYGAVMCKLCTSIEATNVFVSVSSITAIAMDRYQVIVYPTSASMQKLGAVITLLAIWVGSFLLAIPMLLFRRLISQVEYSLKFVHEMPPEVAQVFYDGLRDYHMCLEDPDLKKEYRLLYGVSSMVITYVLPIFTVAISYWRISARIRRRMKFSANRGSRRKSTDDAASSASVHLQHSCQNGGAPSSATSNIAAQRRMEEERRQRKTTMLLVAISCVFAISWFPLYIFNILGDADIIFEKLEAQDLMLIFALCHAFGMSSACSNPILYGYLNDNFRKEFKEILCALVSYIPTGACCAGRDRLGTHHRLPVVIYSKPSGSTLATGRLPSGGPSRHERSAQDGKSVSEVPCNGQVDAAAGQDDTSKPNGHLDDAREMNSCATQASYLLAPPENADNTTNNNDTPPHSAPTGTKNKMELTLTVPNQLYSKC